MTLKIAIHSDFHLEHLKSIPSFKNNGSDVLVLGGDICLANHLYRHPRGNYINNAENADKAKLYREFFQYCNDNWKHVIYFSGNHEHYSGLWNKTNEILIEEMQNYPNIHFCDQTRVDIEDVTFLGVSLWTDFNGGDPLTMVSIKNMMNDYHAITEENNGAYHKLRPITTFNKHKSDVEWLQSQLTELSDRKVVICSHHAPSRLSIHHDYSNQYIMNGAFVSNLENLILDNPQIKLFTHGHVHNVFNYMIGDTNVICNPHGYPKESRTWDANLIVEV